MSREGEAGLTKDFAVVDCDGHVFEPAELWTDIVEPEYREAVRGALWREDTPGGFDGWLNGVPHLKRRDDPHFDAEDAWEAIGHMRAAVVPEPVVAKLMGANAARMYGITPMVFVREQRPARAVDR